MNYTDTKEQFETLQKYEGQLYNALNLNYARVGEPNMIADLNRISKEVSNIEIIGGCSHCLMNHLKRLIYVMIITPLIITITMIIIMIII